jgi:hypothetical protein
MSSQSDRSILTFTIKGNEREIDAARRVLKERAALLTGVAVEPVTVLQADAGFRCASQKRWLRRSGRGKRTTPGG